MHASFLINILLFYKGPGRRSGLACGAVTAGLGKDDIAAAAAGAYRDTNPSLFVFRVLLENCWLNQIAR